MASRLDIPYGRENAISKKALCGLWGCDDRAVRSTIATMRRLPCDDGCAILSSSSQLQPGYWRSDDPAEISEFIRETESRAKACFLAVREARQVLKNSRR